MSQIATPNLALGLVQSGFKILGRIVQLLPVLKCMEGDRSLIGQQKKKNFQSCRFVLFDHTLKRSLFLEKLLKYKTNSNYRLTTDKLLLAEKKQNKKTRSTGSPRSQVRPR